MWEPYKKGFKAWLQLEKSLADNSVEAYLRDIEKLTDYLQTTKRMVTPQELKLKDLENFVQWTGELGMTVASQSRIISGMKSFYRYCVMEQVVTANPTELLESPRQKRILPDTLSFEEIESIIAQIDL
ncbi:MAG TPA: site-specific integrase, partial [Ferruginibacter sp.]|nr:site-specific integrase [Ferruginibacter sp.]